MKQKIDIILKEIFNFKLPEEELDGGEYIQDTEIFKTLSEQLDIHKPARNKEIEVLSFEFAKKALAIQFNRGSNYGSFSSDGFDHLFETQFEKINIEDLVLILDHFGFLNSFNEKNLSFDSDKLLVMNSVTGEIISFQNIEQLIMAFLEVQLGNQIQRIILVLNVTENRNFWISKLSRSDKAEYIKSATQKFDSLVGLSTSS